MEQWRHSKMRRAWTRHPECTQGCHFITFIYLGEVSVAKVDTDTTLLVLGRDIWFQSTYLKTPAKPWPPPLEYAAL